MKLKCLSLIVMTFLFLFVGCNKNAFFDERTDANGDANLKSAELKMVPIKGNIKVVLKEFALANGIPTPVKGPLEGSVSHLGDIKEGSYWEAYRYVRHDNDQPPYIDYGINGKFVAANGDELLLTTEGKIFPKGNEDGLDWVGTINFTGGTGRFEKASGEGSSTGLLTWENGIPLTVEMNSEGIITNVGQSK
jgi:hypothetical protein